MSDKHNNRYPKLNRILEDQISYSLKCLRQPELSLVYNPHFKFKHTHSHTSHTHTNVSTSCLSGTTCRRELWPTLLSLTMMIIRFPGGSDSKKICLQCRRPGFDPLVGKIPWRRERQPTPVFFPGEVHEQRNLTGYSPWGYRESDVTWKLNNNSNTADKTTFTPISWSVSY